MIVPKLRFSEFKDEWNEKLLSDFTTFSKGKGLSKSDIVKNGKNPCIRYGELYTTYGSTISEAISYTNLDKNNCVLSKKNQIIIPSSGETQIDIATASCVLSDDIILGGDLNILTTNENGIFLAYYLSSAKKNDIAQLAQGNSVVHLYAKELATLKINYPSKEEQTKIAEFLSAVDDKISQLSQQLELLNQYKKGVMQKIFSQEIRFKNENGEDFEEWENSFIGNECKITTGNKDTQNKIDDGIYPFFVRSQTVERINSYSMDCEAILTSGDGVGVGKNYHYINGKFDFHQRVYCLYDFSERLNGKYLFIYFSQFFFDRVKRLSAKNSVDSVRMDMISKMEIKLPSTPEQEKIAEFLTAIDERIDHTTAQLTHTKQWKKGLLQQMFV